MEQVERVPCPYCRELILPGALKCKECGSNLTSGSARTWLQPLPRVWARNQGDRKLLGVASCIATNLRVSPTLVRLVFVLLTFVSLLGLFLYLILAMIIPPAPGERSAFETMVDMMGAAVDNFSKDRKHAAAVAAAADANAGYCVPQASPSPSPSPAPTQPSHAPVPPPVAPLPGGPTV